MIALFYIKNNTSPSDKKFGEFALLNLLFERLDFN